MEIPSFHCPDAAAIAALPHGGKKPLCRDELRALSRDTKTHPLVAYACIMAWGGRDFGNYRRSLDDGGNAIIKLVKALRKSTATRRDDFQLTQTAARSIPGLGISFYTKLLFFLRKQPNAYILDQWTAKSSIVLFPELGIRLNAFGLPDFETTGQTYDAFCSHLEACCGSDGWGVTWRTGEEVERTLFDNPKGPWRQGLKSLLEGSKSTRKATRQPRAVENADVGNDPVLRAFAEAIRTRYLKVMEQGLALPDGCGYFARPNRLHVLAQRGAQFQFILNRKEVRAQIFFPKDGVALYDGLVEKLHPADDGRRHDFGQGITGNGPMKRITRQISLPAEVSGGYASPQAEWIAIAESAVEAMATLFGFLEQYLKARLDA